ncbi:hypothetical protein E1B28_007814 [Marasmius oreades]|uniref:Uncharacterized protein n=1 Tax=Marasmius oreades TaxID=181124 RepID=A0A9P7S340_9AGAR|nr:uncharacterized protein E1B28_007814 [Marasmius oreades]KAG7094207.1 hypothetical protein E1B28_007814 [Marasmius oreades]
MNLTSSFVHRKPLSQFFRLITQLNLAPVNCIFVFDGRTCPKSQCSQREISEYQLYDDAKSFIEPAGFHCHVAPGKANAELVEMNQRGVIDMILTTDGDTNLLALRPLCVAQVNSQESHQLNELVLNIYDINAVRHALPESVEHHCKRLLTYDLNDGHSVDNAIKPTTSWTISPLGPSTSHWVPLIQDIQALTKCCRSTLNWTDDKILRNFEQKVYAGAVTQILCSKQVYYDYRDGSLLAARLTQQIANQTTLLNPKPVLPISVLNPQTVDPQETVPATFSTRYFIQDVLLALGQPSSNIAKSGDSSIQLHVPVVLLLAATNPSRYGRVIDQPSPPISQDFRLLEGAPSAIHRDD